MSACPGTQGLPAPPCDHPQPHFKTRSSRSPGDPNAPGASTRLWLEDHNVPVPSERRVKTPFLHALKESLFASTLAGTRASTLAGTKGADCGCEKRELKQFHLPWVAPSHPFPSYTNTHLIGAFRYPRASPTAFTLAVFRYLITTSRLPKAPRTAPRLVRQHVPHKYILVPKGICPIHRQVPHLWDSPFLLDFV